MTPPTGTPATGVPRAGGLDRIRSSIGARIATWSPRRLRAVVWAVLALPFVLAAFRLLSREYHPVLDQAMAEFRVRDVGTGDTPLIGLPGRIFPPGRVGDYTVQGSHPGPLSFYLLAPTYRILGSSAWGLLVGMIVLNLAAIALALWIAHRRGGLPVTLVMAGTIVLLVRGYGFEVVTQPWNPYLPLLFWLVVLLGTWSVLAGDRSMIVVVTAVACLCAQTHLPYVGLSLGMGALCVLALLWHWYRHPVDRNDVTTQLGRSAIVGVVLWLPPLWNQLTGEPGNLRMIIDYFRNPPEESVGLGEGVRLMLRHLDLVRMAGDAFGADGYVTRAGYDLQGSVVPGVVVVLVWLATVAIAFRMRHRVLLTLHLVIGWSLVLGVVSMSRIFGKVWFYLTLWAWTSATLLAVAVVWTLLVWARGRLGADRVRSLWSGVAVAAAVVVVGSYAALTAEAFGAEAPEQHLSDTLREVTGPTIDALRSGVGAATGDDGTYLVTWSDARYFGSQGFGLVNELDRAGFDVGALPVWRVPATPSRVVDPADATAEVRLATGVYVDAVAALPGAEEVVRYDPRDPDELAEYEQLQGELEAGLTAAGLEPLIALIDTNLFGLQLDPAVSPELQRVVDRMLELGTPTAVFVLPPGSPDVTLEAVGG